MKEAWVRLDRWSKKMVTAALEAGADAVVVPAGWQERVKELGRIITVSDDGDLRPSHDVFFEQLQSPENEARIARLLRTAPVVIDQRHWEVIPLENLVAVGGKLLVAVDSAEKLELALGILEKGVGGVVIVAEEVSQLNWRKDAKIAIFVTKTHLICKRFCAILNKNGVITTRIQT